jgi:hypothetical protein
LNYSTPFSAQVTAEDALSPPVNYYLNSSLFTINSSGHIANNTNLVPGIYNFLITANDTLGNINSTIYQLTITKASSNISLYLNNSKNNITISLNSTLLINATRITGEENITLYINNIPISNGTNIYNYSFFNTVGLHNVTAIYPETQNYTYSFKTLFVEVIDYLYPIINITYPINNDTLIHYFSSILQPVNFTVQDDTLKSCWYNLTGVQNISNTLINCNNGNNNFSVNISNSGDYTMFVSANDSNNNIAFSVINFTINLQPQFIGGGGGQTSQLIIKDVNVIYNRTWNINSVERVYVLVYDNLNVLSDVGYLVIEPTIPLNYSLTVRENVGTYYKDFYIGNESAELLLNITARADNTIFKQVEVEIKQITPIDNFLFVTKNKFNLFVSNFSKVIKNNFYYFIVAFFIILIMIASAFLAVFSKKIKNKE